MSIIYNVRVITSVLQSVCKIRRSCRRSPVEASLEKWAAPRVPGLHPWQVERSKVRKLVRRASRRWLQRNFQFLHGLRRVFEIL